MMHEWKQLLHKNSMSINYRLSLSLYMDGIYKYMRLINVLSASCWKEPFASTQLLNYQNITPLIVQ